MSKKTIYLHAGFHKTGTSTIQEVLFTHQKELASTGEGYFYSPTLERNHSIPLYSMFCAHPEKYRMNIKKGRNTRPQVDAYITKVEKQITKELRATACRHILFSGEDISRLDEPNLEALKAFFRQVLPDADIRILLCTREPGSLAASLHQEAIKSGDIVSRNALFKQFRTFFRSNIGKFFQVFGRSHVHVYTFEDACEHRLGLMGAFLSNLGIAETAIAPLISKTEQQTNVSVSHEVVGMLEYINTCLPLIEKGTISTGRSRRDTQPLESIRGEKFQFAPPQVRRIENISKEDRDWLKRELGIQYTAPKSTLNTSQLYDTPFCTDLLAAFPECSQVIRFLVVRYLTTLLQQKKWSPPRRNRLRQLKRQIQQTYPESAQGNGIDEQLKTRIENRAVPGFRYMEQFLENVGDLSAVAPGTFYRELALLCKAHRRDSAALYFMRQAKRFIPSGPFIQQKITEWSKQGKSIKRNAAPNTKQRGKTE
ncbi:MAG: hypothetical protein JXX29_03210 [Deltaproteobacteria bacterium]|nr:hypothetical protein [Deltaproteobacteria bacterium]MBN2670650.1 hypothetical protein [Deltaproteobacteria bacterium]